MDDSSNGSLYAFYYQRVVVDNKNTDHHD